MNSKFMMAGVFVGGVVFGWAVMADKAERDQKKMLAEFEEFVKERDQGWEELVMDKTEQIFALKHQIVSAEVKEEQKPIPSFREGRLLDPDEVFDLPQTAALSDQPQKIPGIVVTNDEVGKVVEFSKDHLRLVDAQGQEMNLLSTDPDAEVEPFVGEDPGDAEVDDNDFEEPIIDETIEETRSNLQALINRYVPNDEEAEAFVEHAQKAAVADRRPPFVIDKNVYAYDEEGEHYEKITIFYYPRERVLLDDGEEPITDVNGYVGWKSLSRFGDGSGDPDVVFVRNPRMETDFEVIRQEHDQKLPLHVSYGMDKTVFESRKAAGLLKLRPEDID